MAQLTLGQIADVICHTLTLPEVAEYYGYELKRGGFICCPFHTEKTASCKVSDKLFHCFGCGEGGNLIQFVEKLFQLDFKDALVKIDNDFRLLLTGQSVSPEQRRKAEAIRKKREEECKQKDEQTRYIKKLEDKYLQCWKYLTIFKPPEAHFDINTSESLVNQWFDNLDERYLWGLNNFAQYQYLAQAYNFDIDDFEAKLLFLQ